MNHVTRPLALCGVTLALLLTGCSSDTDPAPVVPVDDGAAQTDGGAAQTDGGAAQMDGGAAQTNGGDNDGGSHTHADGTVHADSDHDGPAHAGGDVVAAPGTDAGRAQGTGEWAVGPVTVGGATLAITLSGAITANQELYIDIVQTAGPRPAALRLWAGVESGAGSLKVKADGHDNHFHSRTEMPAEVTADAKLWLEVETADGTREVVGVPLK